MHKFLIIGFSCWSVLCLFKNYFPAYYADVLLSGDAMTTLDLKVELNQILNAGHVRVDGSADKLVAEESCSTTANCYSHVNLGYKGARTQLFGKIHLQLDQNNQYFVQDIYCLKNFADQDFPVDRSIGPLLIPEHTVMNTEHVWPQSRFKDNLTKDEGEMHEKKKSDLHILYPSDEELNSARGNFEFADVVVVTKSHSCSSAKNGYPQEDSSKQYFEPPLESKGNVARSIFYFSVKYNVPINEVEEGYLRQWNKLDPVDNFEKSRNELIYEVQNVRNPFIDQPVLVDYIKNF